MHRLLSASLALALLSIPSGASAITCSHGVQSHPASKAEALAAGIVEGAPICPEDASVGITAEAGTAKQYLQSLGNGSGTTRQESFQNLNSAFAVCAARFLKEYQSRYGTVKISSAWRSQADQLRVCPVPVAGKCGGSSSNHTRGLALDVSPASGNFQQMWGFAKANPAFGVCFPFEGGDRVHLILQGIPGSGESTQCTQKGYGNQPCSGVNFNPGEIRDAAQQPVTPTQQLMSGLQQMMRPQQQPQPQPSTAPAATQPTTAYTTPQPSPVSTGSATTPTQPTATTPSPTITPTPTPPAVSDLINAIADPSKPKATPTPNGTAIALSGALNNVATIAPAPPAPTTPPGTYRLSPGQVPTTFTSDDLANTSRQAYASKPSDTFALQILEGLKQTLLTVLSYLRPFRGSDPRYGSTMVME